MSEAFAHLHVASGFSLRYGASTPATLVERAAALGQPALALTDRDGLYGAIRFVQACDEAGIAPVLGVDLAVTSPPPPGSLRAPGSPGSPGSPGWSGAPGRAQAPGRPPTASRPRGRTHPVRGGADVDPRHPRVTVLARGQAGGAAPGAGWAALVPAGDQHPPARRARRRGQQRGAVAEHATDRRTGDLALTVLLGPDSDVGRALLERRTRPGPRPAAGLAERAAAERRSSSRWSATAARRAPRPASATRPACWRWPPRPGCRRCSPPRCATPTPGDAATVDVLDAARRLVAARPPPPRPGHHRRPPQLRPSGCARSPARSPGGRSRVSDGATASASGPTGCSRDTVALAPACAQDPARRPRHRLGAPARAVGRSGSRPATIPQARARGAVPRARSPPATPGRAEPDLRTVGVPARGRARGHRRAGLPDLLPHRRGGRRPDPRHGGPGRGARLGRRQPGQLPARHQRGRPDAPRPAHGAVLLAAAGRAARHRHRRGVGPPHRDLRAGPRALRRRPGHLRVDDGHLPGAPRDPRRRRPRSGCRRSRSTRSPRRSRTSAPATPATPSPSCPSCVPAAWTRPGCDLLFDLVERLDGLPRHIALHPCGVVLSDARPAGPHPGRGRAGWASR